MDLPTQTHQKTLRDLLMHRLGKLRAEVQSAEQEHRTMGDTGAGGVSDWKEEVMRGQLAAVSGQQEERDHEDLIRVEAALQRLDSGTYGDCQACGEPIPLQRLLVQPSATRCADCQTMFEARMS